MTKCLVSLFNFVVFNSVVNNFFVSVLTSVVFLMPIQAQMIEGSGNTIPLQNPPVPGFGEILSKMSPMLMMVFFIFYFLVVRPQNKKLLDQQKLLGELKKGDNVLTNSGMHAKVFSIESDHLILEPATGIKIKFDKTSIASRVG